MKRWTAVAIAVLFVAACDKESPEGAAAEAEATSEAASAAVEEVEEAARYDKEMRKRACEILTPKMVAGAFDVPAGDLEQTRAMGCIYNWERDEETLQVRFGSIRVHKNTGVAKTWFENATRGMTAEETRKAMAEITEKARDDERIDTESKKKTADNVGGMLGEMGGVTFADVDGVGDEARENVDDGELWVRLGNMTFIVNAYKGPKQPPLEFKMEKGKMKEYMREVQKANRQWTRKTLDERQAASRKVARMVIDEL